MMTLTKQQQSATSTGQLSCSSRATSSSIVPSEEEHQLMQSTSNQSENGQKATNADTSSQPQSDQTSECANSTLAQSNCQAEVNSNEANHKQPAKNQKVYTDFTIMRLLGLQATVTNSQLEDPVQPMSEPSANVQPLQASDTQSPILQTQQQPNLQIPNVNQQPSGVSSSESSEVTQVELPKSKAPKKPPRGQRKRQRELAELAEKYKLLKAMRKAKQDQKWRHAVCRNKDGTLTRPSLPKAPILKQLEKQDIEIKTKEVIKRENVFQREGTRPHGELLKEYINKASGYTSYSMYMQGMEVEEPKKSEEQMEWEEWERQFEIEWQKERERAHQESTMETEVQEVNEVEGAVPIDQGQPLEIEATMSSSDSDDDAELRMLFDAQSQHSPLFTEDFEYVPVHTPSFSYESELDKAATEGALSLVSFEDQAAIEPSEGLATTLQHSSEPLEQCSQKTFYSNQMQKIPILPESLLVAQNLHYDPADCSIPANTTLAEYTKQLIDLTVQINQDWSGVVFCK